ncbi:hypothetical protein [Pedobacter roseus]|uniref:Uncharacterized protein n=1 Tax=Pedobacter roseus TaxID=336820 RepID=A0A7G9QGZ8_9SPHI|nr:hypothetical protein [Pedobacter roseus]QNN42623.1 hypothetical protein H9L23_00445 [Pedobacter roseus]
MGSSSLSFNQKVELLTEVKYYSKEQKEKLNRFAEIRNKFAHLAEIKNFEDCFNSIQGLESKLLKWFPEIMQNKTDSKEDTFSKCFSALFETIAADIERFVEHYNNRLFERVTLEVKAINYDAMLIAMSEVEKEFDPEIMEKFAKRFIERTDEIFRELDQKKENEKAPKKTAP